MVEKIIKICHIFFDVDNKRIITPSELRRCISTQFSDISEFHHHSDESYHYPLIQYKRINNVLSIIGINKYADIINDKLSNLEQLTLKPGIDIRIKNIKVQNSTFTLNKDLYSYRFISPWIALNKKNYEIQKKNRNNFLSSDFLEKILIGNILTMYNGVDVFINERIKVSIFRRKPSHIIAHNNRFIGLYIEFACNMNIPEYFGLGKSVSKGFGMISEIVKK
jgi:hypothetical protein